MLPLLLDWLNLLLRWFHVMAGIGWIGTSFFFVWLDMSLRANPALAKGVYGESWMVHGGGFYHAQKYLVAPATLPRELHWFKYEAYFTFLSGFLLLAVVYYLGARQFLIDPAVMDLSPGVAIALSVASLAAGWLVYDSLCRSPLVERPVGLAVGVFFLAAMAATFYTQVFSGRAAFLHFGAFLGSIMAANVFAVIIPNQKKVVADLIAGRAPDPALGQQAKQRSLHNNYLTLPVVLMMISSHYPMLTEQPYAWGALLLILIGAALVRHYFNLTEAGRHGNWIDWMLVYAAGVAVILVVMNINFTLGDRPQVSGPPATLAEALPVIQNRCLSCHSATPSDARFRAAPKGIVFDSPADVARYAPQILRVAVLSRAMPLGNRTGMTEEERALVGRWAVHADE